MTSAIICKARKEPRRYRRRFRFRIRPDFIAAVAVASFILSLTSSRTSHFAAAGTSRDAANDVGTPSSFSSYEEKMKRALEYYASRSDELMHRSLKEGLAAEEREVVVSEDGRLDDEELYANFASQAIGEELGRLGRIRRRLTRWADSADEEDEDDDDSDDSDDEEEDSDDEEEEIDEQGMKRRLLDPEKWYSFTYWQLHDWFLCDSFEDNRPIYTQEQWRIIRDHYNKFVIDDLAVKPIPKGHPERTYKLEKEMSYPDFPVKPVVTKKKGRGIAASRDIAKGEMVFRSTNNTIAFRHGHTFRMFLWSVYDNPEFDDDPGKVCDILVWSWLQRAEKDGPLEILMDLDEGSLMNEGRDSDEMPRWEAPNIRCGEEGKDCELAYFATNDIKEGAELLCDYRDFAEVHAWPAMGL